MKYTAVVTGSFLTFIFTSGAVGVTTPVAWATSSDGVYKLSSYTAPVQGNGNPGSSSTWKLSVDDTSSGHKQTIDGFGAAVTDATVSVFNDLSASQKTALLNDLFTTSTNDGVAFNLLRHTIGASDLSATEYSYSNSTDTSLSNFDLQPAGEAMLSVLNQFKAKNSAIKLLGSVWSPPGWMKNNGVMDGNANGNSLNTAYASQFAQYFVKYIQAFSSGGVNVDAITIQNEPLNNQAGYPTMSVPASQSAQLIQNNVGPALKSAGLSTQIWAYDHNTDVPSYPQTVLDSAGSFVNTVAWHCYATNNDWGSLTTFHNSNPNVAQYMTECWTSPTNTWYSTADFIMGPLQNWASGVIAWTLGSDTSYGPHLSGGCSTCRGLFEVNTGAGTYSKTLDYYIMGQFSRFVPRGSINLATTGSHDYGGGSKFEATSFLNSDGSRTVVMQNNFNNPVYVTVTFNSGDSWSGPVYTQSITTWQLPPTSG
ncbi:beta-1,6-glucanase Neg1 [Xylogone sp. PMI_703]|nr:beta-1,6-glucanase Neg1 [Xylogone sp. PMI_703]